VTGSDAARSWNASSGADPPQHPMPPRRMVRSQLTGYRFVRRAENLGKRERGRDGLASCCQIGCLPDMLPCSRQLHALLCML
jgi:hypothetical protein